MTRDLNKNIVSMKYNYLNLPDTVQMLNGNFVTYMWDGTGSKVRSWHRTYQGSTATIPVGATLLTWKLSNTFNYTSGVGIITDYFENFVYDNQCLRRYFFDDGIAINTNNSNTTTATPSFVYHYYLKDHLGNNRAVIHDSGNGTPVIDQVNNYYPFGMEYGEEASIEGVEQDYQKQLYSGKEFDDDFQMNSYDFGARSMSVDVPVWRTIDPLAEKYCSISPYAYCVNNPINVIDPYGLDVRYTQSGDRLAPDGSETDNILIVYPNYFRLPTNGEDFSLLGNSEPDEITKNIGDVSLTAKAYSKIYTDILSQMDGVNLDDLYNRSVSVLKYKQDLGLQLSDFYNSPLGADDDLANIVRINDKVKLSTYIIPERTNFLLSTVSNVQSVLGAHEYFGHFKKGLSNEIYVYKFQFNHPTWKNTTSIFKYIERKLAKTYE